MTRKIHQVTQLRSVLPGTEILSLLSEHAFPRHAHDQFGIGVITAGAQASWSGVGVVESALGDVIMVNPGEVHDGTPIGGPRGWRIVYLEPGLITRELAVEFGRSDAVFQPVAHDRLLASAVARLLEALPSVATGNEAEELMLACLVRLMKAHRLSGPRPPAASPPVARALEWIEAAPAADVPLSELAASCDASRFQLIRGFLREVGITPHAYRIQLRVRLARRYLRQGLAVAEAALLAGFADQSHPTRAFVRQFGITPGRYRAALL